MYLGEFESKSEAGVIPGHRFHRFSSRASWEVRERPGREALAWPGCCVLSRPVASLPGSGAAFICSRCSEGAALLRFHLAKTRCVWTHGSTACVQLLLGSHRPGLWDTFKYPFKQS